MNDEDKSKDQLINELEELRRRVAGSGKTESTLANAQDPMRQNTEQYRKLLSQNEEFLSEVFSSIQDGICVLDTSHTIIRVNPSMENWYDHKMPLVGKKCYEAFHGLKDSCDVCPATLTMETGIPAMEVVPLHGEDDEFKGWLELHTFPMFDQGTDSVIGVIEYVRNITKRKIAEEKKERLLKELQEALSEVKTLSGMLPICAGCKKIRDDKGYWNQIEGYIQDHSDAVFSHGICPECSRKLYPELHKDD